MEINYVVVVAFITFVVAEVLKVVNINAKYIPLFNLGTGIISGLICYFTGITPTGTVLLFLETLGMCIIASCGAGGFYDVLKTKIADRQISQIEYKKAVKLYGEPVGEVEPAPVTHDENEAKL